MVDSGTSSKSSFHGPLVSLSDALRRRKLVVVMGAGASIQAGIPSWAELIDPFRRELFSIPSDSSLDPRLSDPLYVAEIYEQKFGKPAFRRRVVESIYEVKIPSPIHAAVAALDVSTIFTTNYDDLMERALESLGKKYHVMFQDVDYSYHPSADTISVIKLHGDLRNPSSMVLTMSEVLGYFETHPNMLGGFKDKLKTNSALFVGISMRDSNLERIFESALRELHEHGMKHYILVKDWHELLRQYYHLHGLEPIPVASWDEVVDFLTKLRNKADQLPAATYPELRRPMQWSPGVGEEALSKVAKEAVRGLQHEYTDLRRRHRAGERKGILEETLQLWNRLEEFSFEEAGPLKVDLLLLLALLHLQAFETPDLRAAERYLSTAESMADDSRRNAIGLGRSLWLHASGRTQEALSLLEGLSDEQALRIRFGILIELGGNGALEQLIEVASSKADTDVEWAWLLAKCYLERRQLQEAKQAINPWLITHPSDPTVLRMAGTILAEIAEERHRQFCREYNLFEQFSVVLNHNELVSCDLAREAAQNFQQAADQLKELGETRDASSCYKYALALHQICGTDTTVLLDLLDKMAVLGIETPIIALKRLYDNGILLQLDADDFAQMFNEREFFLITLMRLRDWARERTAWHQAALLLDRDEVRNQADSIELQAGLAMISMELWENVGDSSKALEAIERFTPPVEYAYFPLVLKVGHYIYDQDDAQVNPLLDQLIASYGNHPMVLALRCQWHELKQQWVEMRDVAAQLIDCIAIPQTFDFYLTALGRLQESTKLLDGLSRAKHAGIKLGPTWTHINRARALMAVGRVDEALDVYDESIELEHEGRVSLKSEDFFLMLGAHVRKGNRLKARELAEELTHKNPDHPGGYLALSRLLMQENDYRRAFDTIEDAAKRLPDVEAIQAEYIHTGLVTGRGADVAEIMKRFRERWPESKLLRLVPREEGFRLYKESIREAEFVEQMYRAGGFPAVQAAYLQSSVPSYFKFWHARTRARAGLYVACGEQGEEWRELRNAAPHIKSGVMDFPALVTAFELELRWGKWEQCLRSLFPVIYLPSSFRDLLAIEASSLLGDIQESRFRSLRRLRDIVDSNPNLFPRNLIPRIEGLPDAVEHETEREFSARVGRFYFNEYGSEEGRLPQEFGFQELAVRLSGTGQLSPSQQRRLEQLARRRDFRPLPLGDAALDGIVADIMTLQALSEADLLDAVIPFFKKIMISELGKERLLSEVAWNEFKLETERRFRDFESYLNDRSEWIQWVDVTEEARKRLGFPIREDLHENQRRVLMYMADLYAVTLAEDTVLITDDRLTRMVFYGDVAAKGPTLSFLRLGSDTLLRYFFRNPEGRIDADGYREHYLQLMQWNYRHLPLDSEIVTYLWPQEPSVSLIPPESPLWYFRDSVAEYGALAGRDELFAKGLFAKVLIQHDRELAVILHRSFKENRTPEQTGLIMSMLAQGLIIEQFRGRETDSLVSIIAQVLIERKDLPVDDSGGGAVSFFSWLDKSLRAAGFTEQDVDLAWQYYIVQFIESEVPGIPRGQVLAAASRSLSQIVFALPKRTREQIFESYAGRVLREKLGWEVEETRYHVWRPASGQPGEEITLSDTVITAFLNESLPDILARKWTKRIKAGVSLLPQSRDEDSFAVVVNVLPQSDKESLMVPPIIKTANVLDLFYWDDPAVRHGAWNRGLVKLRRFDRDTGEWELLRAELIDASEDAWRRAAAKCIDVLMSDRDIASDIISEASGIDVQMLLRNVVRLRLDHVQHWFRPTLLAFKDESDLTAFSEEIAASVRRGGHHQWQMIREFAFHSLFPDAEVYRKQFVNDLLEECGNDVSELERKIFKLLDEGEVNPSPIYKINVVLVVLETAQNMPKRHDGFQAGAFWTRTESERKALPIHRRVSALVSEAIQPAGSVFAQESSLQNELVGLCVECSAALSTLWQSFDNTVSPETRRYLACLTGGYLVAAIARRHPDAKVDACREIRQKFAELAVEKTWTQTDRAPGFYRPIFARSLNYPACFAVHGMRQHAETVQAYIINRELRELLLVVASLHRLFHTLLWGGDSPVTSWLDGRLEVGMNSGIDDFLRQAAGSMLEYWTKDDLKILNQLNEPINMDSWLEELYKEAIRVPAEALKASLNTLITVIWLKHVAGKNWQQWMRKCLAPRFLKRVRSIEALYRLLIINISGLLLKEDLEKGIRTIVRKTVFTEPKHLKKHYELQIHLEAMVLLMHEHWYDEAFDSWLRRMCEDSSIPFNHRRQALRVLTDHFDNLPTESRARVGLILQAVTGLREWKTAAELMRFRKGEA